MTLQRGVRFRETSRAPVIQAKNSSIVMVLSGLKAKPKKFETEAEIQAFLTRMDWSFSLTERLSADLYGYSVYGS